MERTRRIIPAIQSVLNHTNNNPKKERRKNRILENPSITSKIFERIEFYAKSNFCNYTNFISLTLLPTANCRLPTLIVVVRNEATNRLHLPAFLSKK